VGEEADVHLPQIFFEFLETVTWEPMLETAFSSVRPSVCNTLELCVNRGFDSVVKQEVKVI